MGVPPWHRGATFRPHGHWGVIAMSKSHGAKCGHVKRQLREGKRLTGEMLEFALSTLPQPEVRRAGKDDLWDFYDGIRKKLVAGESLDDYETDQYFGFCLSRFY
jgi:hypothetical protein